MANPQVLIAMEDPVVALPQIRDDLSTVKKSILVFFTILWAIAVLVAVVALLVAAG